MQAPKKRGMERRLMRFRANNIYNLNGKTVLLVDDGIATGATIFEIL